MKFRRKSRRFQEDNESTEHDSFLDIVANIVGILIILVMVVSVRAKDVPLLAIGAKTVDLETPQLKAKRLKTYVESIDAKTQTLSQEIQMRKQEQLAMVTLELAVEQELEKRRSELNEHARENFDQRRHLATEANELQQIEQALSAAKSMSKKEVVKLETFSTPLGRTVMGKEVHFRLLGGRIAYLPVEELSDEMKAEARAKTWNLDNQASEFTDVIGPREGFRMRYTIEKVEIPVEVRVKTGRTGYIYQLKYWELISTKKNVGVPIETALKPGSRVNEILRDLNPDSTTITLWVYPDSFATFRALKKDLFLRGFATAGRPLPPGVSIAGSPTGTRSNAE